MVNKLLIFILLLFSVASFGQTKEAMKDSILHKIYKLQCKNDAFYADGLFPSQRGKKEDNTIFFTGLITYTLQNIRQNFSTEQQILIDSMLIRAKKNYPNYADRKGGITYNFSQIRPIEMPMPNNKILSKWEKILLPDDLDDSAILFLTQNNPTNDSLLKEKMNKYTFIPLNYKNYTVYYNWFTHNSKSDFDICVLANVLLFVFEKKLPLNDTDLQTIALITEIVNSNEHIKNPHIISCWYKNTSVILYTIARMLASNPTDERLLPLKTKIIADLKNGLKTNPNKMEQVLLLSSLARLEQEIPFTITDFSTIQTDFDSFHFFYLSHFAVRKIYAKNMVGADKLVPYSCEAYHQTLLLEYLCLMDKK